MTEKATTPMASGTEGIVVLLVDDQPIIGEAVRRMLLPHPDIRFHYCKDPTKALALAAELRPTVILQDLVMPEVDGLDLVRDYRRQEATLLTPLIVLSSREEAVTKAEAFARGANDYLVKLPDPVEVIARIRYHSRGYIALLERNAAYEALARSEKALMDELTKAADYVRSLLPAPLSAPVATDWRYIPTASLGGDAFDYLWLDDDRLVIYLLDVSGHGVGPALLSISVMNMLRTRGLRNADFGDPGSVLRALNDSFQMSEHSMFFTMWYGVYSRRTSELRYAGAGHPPSLLAAPGVPLRQLDSHGLVVGIMPGQEYTTDVVAVPSGSRLLLYSDGVFEIQIGDKIMWSIDDFIEYFGQLPDEGTPRLDRVLAKARALKGSDALDDDFSIVELTFP
jgi:sigma-B regulation protein RsbU (phosphoserine phosphatase)